MPRALPVRSARLGEGGTACRVGLPGFPGSQGHVRVFTGVHVLRTSQLWNHEASGVTDSLEAPLRHPLSKLLSSQLPFNV